MVPHADKYRDYAHLSQHEVRPRDFDFSHVNRHSDPIIIAPHGGGIEPGTSELAQAIAGKDYSLYLFGGRKSANNWELHISSHRFDAPGCRPLIRSARYAVTIHGEGSTAPVLFLGGLDRDRIDVMRMNMKSADYEILRHDDPDLQGEHPENICNLGTSGAGVQLEISKGLREKFFASLTREGRSQPTAAFHEFVAAVRFCL